jgi:hypothetical protein
LERREKREERREKREERRENIPSLRIQLYNLKKEVLYNLEI